MSLARSVGKALADTSLQGLGIGYTLATGRLFCEFSDFQRYAEELLGRPILTHEFASEETWAELRDAFEASVLERA